MFDPNKALPNGNSMTLAEAFIAGEGTDADRRILYHWGGDFFLWDSAANAYRRQDPERFRAKVQAFLKTLKVRDTKNKVKPYQPEPSRVKAVIETLAGECQAIVDRMPTWLDDHRPDVADTVPFSNGLLNLRSLLHSGELTADPVIPPTPSWFSEVALPYRFDPAATCPSWLHFLNAVLPVDRHPGSVQLLQEWCGYMLTADTRMQKVMLFVGPPRAGKGTIIRVIQRLLGDGNTVSPPMDSLGERFGLEPLVGKRAALIPDAHLGRNSDAVKVLDKLLLISGEDAVTVDRKNRPALPSVRLGVRFTIACNQPPDLPDSSGALIARLLVIQFRESFLGREDLNLDERLAAEAPGIAIWALHGLIRLRTHGRFTDPADQAAMKTDYQRQTAPIVAFLQDRTTADPDPRALDPNEEAWVTVEDLWSNWQLFAKANGNVAGSKEGFGARLRSAAPHVIKCRVSEGGGKQVYRYRGIRLRNPEELFG